MLKPMKCRRCQCYKNEYDVNCIPFSGNKYPEIYFLGEMAGVNEARESQITPAHFIGKSGTILTELLNLISLKRRDIAIANSHRCYKSNNNKPNKKELDACFIHTFNEVKMLKPKLVVALGSIALYQSTGKENIDNHRGKLLWSDKLKCNVYSVYHPMAIGYDHEKKDILENDFKRIPELLNSKPDGVVHYGYAYIETVEQFNRIPKSKDIYLDLESTGLNPYKDKITLLQLGINDFIYIIDPGIFNNIKSKLKLLIESADIIGAGFEFDHKFLSVHLGINIQNYTHDVILAEFLLTGMKNNDLTHLTSKYVPESFGYDDSVKEVGGAHHVRDKGLLLQYSADDIGVLLKIRQKQYKRLAKENMLFLYEKITMPCNRVLTEMSLRGVKYDLDYLMKIDRKYKNKAEKLLFKVMNDVGIKECEKKFRKKFNPRSSQMIQWLLLRYYKLPVLNITKSGNPSIGKEEMKRYAEIHDNSYCEIMGEYRSLQNIRDNFLSGVIPKLVNGVAHTKYSLHAVATGRPNSIDPNLLNIPREKEIKRCIIPRNNCKFVHADFSQLEIRIASVIYNEPELIKICNDETKDTHSIITAKVFNRSYEEIYSGYKSGNVEITELRVKGKAIQFGVLYQEGAEKLAYNLKISKEEAQYFIDEYYNDFPFLKRNIERTKRQVIKDGYMINYFGFRRIWKKHTIEDHATLREAVNFRIQSVAWNLLQLSLIKIDKKLKKDNLKAKLVLQIYDAIVIETPDDEIERVVVIMKDIMRNINSSYKGLNRVKLPIDIEFGNTLADLEKFI